MSIRASCSQLPPNAASASVVGRDDVSSIIICVFGLCSCGRLLRVLLQVFHHDAQPNHRASRGEAVAATAAAKGP